MNPNERILRLPQVMEKVGLKKTAIYDMIKDGTFPKQIKLGKHVSGWLESDIQQWIAGRVSLCREAANSEPHQQAA